MKNYKKEIKILFKKGNKHILCPLRDAYKQKVDESMAKLLFKSVKTNKAIALKPTENVLRMISSRDEFFSMCENVSLSLTYSNRIHATFTIKKRRGNKLDDKYDIYLEPNRKEITAFAEIGHVYIKLTSFEGETKYFDFRNRILNFYEMTSNEKNVIVDLEKHIKLTEIFFSKVR